MVTNELNLIPFYYTCVYLLKKETPQIIYKTAPVYLIHSLTKTTSKYSVLCFFIYFHYTNIQMCTDSILSFLFIMLVLNIYITDNIARLMPPTHLF